jgi:hypothetical protein
MTAGDQRSRSRSPVYALLHPEDQIVEEMLTRWRNQQLRRNLKFSDDRTTTAFSETFLDGHQ